MKIMLFGLIILFVVSCTPKEIKKDICIGIQPFKEFDKKLLDTIRIALNKYYHADIIVFPVRKLPLNAFVNIKTPRFRADYLIRYLKKIKPDSVDYIIGLTNKDISCTKKDFFGNTKSPESKYFDWGIFGLGYRPGSSCIVSTFRLKNRDERIFINRFKKVSVHELGHNFGLNHCKTQKCIMQDAAETIKTIDNVNFELCNNCRKKLKI